MDMLKFERKYWDSNYPNIAGIDEAGRGPLAGPVVATAVIFPQNIDLPEVTDSKKISEKKRERLFKDIYKNAISIGIGIVHEDEIDKKNILQATYVAMRQAIGALSIRPDIVLVDGNKADIKHYTQHSIINGDQKSISIAAASIIAKVTRDRMMQQYDRLFPEFDFAKHKGYGTKKHMDMIVNKKASPIHRKSFNPISKHLPTFSYLKRNHLIGTLGRQLIGCYLIRHGHNILEVDCNISQVEEIDIISIFKDNIVFTKVNTITEINKGQLSDSYDTPLQKSRMIGLIESYMEKHEFDCNFSFNIGTVSLGKNKPKIEITNVYCNTDLINKIKETC